MSSSVRVELDIFSGRPNPVWELDAQAGIALVTRLASLGEGASRMVDLPDLGYRGFVFRSGTHIGRAYRGVIDTNGTVRRDPAFEIERLLLSHLPDAWDELRVFVERSLLIGD